MDEVKGRVPRFITTQEVERFALGQGVRIVDSPDLVSIVGQRVARIAASMGLMSEDEFMRHFEEGRRRV